MKSRYLFVAIAVALFAYLMIQHQQSGAEPTPPKDQYFTGKYIAISAAADHATVLESPELRILGGRTFVVGKIALVNDAWKPLAGNLNWVPVDNIVQIQEFKNIEDVRAAWAYSVNETERELKEKKSQDKTDGPNSN